jgi:hypothetical protein
MTFPNHARILPTQRLDLPPRELGLREGHGGRRVGMLPAKLLRRAHVRRRGTARTGLDTNLGTSARSAYQLFTPGVRGPRACDGPVIRKKPS